jgi:hypothetical protein
MTNRIVFLSQEAIDAFSLCARVTELQRTRFFFDTSMALLALEKEVGLPLDRITKELEIVDGELVPGPNLRRLATIIETFLRRSEMRGVPKEGA